MTPVGDNRAISTEPKSILVVEDNQTTSDLVFEILNQEGYDVVQAHELLIASALNSLHAAVPAAALP